MTVAAPPTRPAWFDAAIADTARIVEAVVDGTVVRARCWGPPGPGVVLVHGGAAHAGWWDHIGPQLSDQRCVLAVDLSGHGDSGHRSVYTLATWADELVALAGAAGITGPLVAVGHSMGGYVTLTAGLRHPDALAAVIVIDSPVPGIAPDPALTREPTVQTAQRRRPTRQAILERFRVIPPDPYVLSYVEDYVAAGSIREDEGGWGWKFDPVSLSRDRALPADLVTGQTRPLAILRAEHGLITEAIAASMAAQYGRPAPVVELPGSGHHVPLDAPLELVVALRTLLAAWPGAR